MLVVWISSWILLFCIFWSILFVSSLFSISRVMVVLWVFVVIVGSSVTFFLFFLFGAVLIVYFLFLSQDRRILMVLLGLFIVDSIVLSCRCLFRGMILISFVIGGSVFIDGFSFIFLVDCLILLVRVRVDGGGVVSWSIGCIVLKMRSSVSSSMLFYRMICFISGVSVYGWLGGVGLFSVANWLDIRVNWLFCFLFTLIVFEISFRSSVSLLLGSGC